jgi:hypothetical protein
MQKKKWKKRAREEADEEAAASTEAASADSAAAAASKPPTHQVAKKKKMLSQKEAHDSKSESAQDVTGLAPSQASAMPTGGRLKCLKKEYVKNQDYLANLVPEQCAAGHSIFGLAGKDAPAAAPAPAAGAAAVPAQAIMPYRLTGSSADSKPADAKVAKPVPVRGKPVSGRTWKLPAKQRTSTAAMDGLRIVQGTKKNEGWYM